MCDAMGATNSVVAGASGGGATAQVPGQMPPVKGGGGGSLLDLLPQLEGIMTALKALVEKLGGGAAAAVAGASVDVAAGGPPKDAKAGATAVANANGGPVQSPPAKVAGESGPGQMPVQMPMQVPPTKVAGDSGPGDKGGKVAGDSGPGQVPTQLPTQVPTKVAGQFGPGQHGFGHQLRRGVGHIRHMGPFQFPGQFPVQVPAQVPGKVAGDSGPGKVEQAPAKAPVTQVAGDSGPGKVEHAPAKVEQAPVKAETPSQVAGDSGSGTIDVPVKSEPTQSAPAQTPPVSQVGGNSSSEPSAPVQQGPVQSQPTQSPAPKAPDGDVKLIEFDDTNRFQLTADDKSFLYFNGDTVAYRPRSGTTKEMTLPSSGFAVTLSDGTKFSYGMNETSAWGEDAGTPRDLEILGANGDLLASRTDDGDDTFGSDGWGVATPLTSYHLLEVASMLFDGSYSKFGSGSGSSVTQSGNVVQQTAK